MADKRITDRDQAEFLANAHTEAGYPTTAEDILAIEVIDFDEWQHARLYDNALQILEEVARREDKTYAAVVSELYETVALAAMFELFEGGEKSPTPESV